MRGGGRSEERGDFGGGGGFWRKGRFLEEGKFSEGGGGEGRFLRQWSSSEEGRASEEEVLYRRRGRRLEDGEVFSEEGALVEDVEVLGRRLHAGLRDDGPKDDASGRLSSGGARYRHVRSSACGVVMRGHQL